MKTIKLMKKIQSLFLAIFLAVPLTIAAQDVVINAENFPDENFRNYLLNQSYGEDGVLTEVEIERITEINVGEQGINSLKGIEYFTALTDLRCYNNQLSGLDVSNNSALSYMDCSFNQLSSLDVSNNPALTYLYCPYNQLSSLDVSNSPVLTRLICDHNQLSRLVVSNNSTLTSLQCYNNQIKGESMDTLISSLPQNTTTNINQLYVYFEGTDGNVITKSQVAAAKEKGWTPCYVPANEWYWIEYEGSDDETTGIGTLRVGIDGKTAIYTINGMRLNTTNVFDLPAGIYIINGKKVVVK